MSEKTRSLNLAATHLDKYLKRLTRLIETTPFDPIDRRKIELLGYNVWLEQIIDHPNPELSLDANIDLGE